MRKALVIGLVSLLVGASLALFWRGLPSSSQFTQGLPGVDQALAARFAVLAQAGNSSCAATFQDAVRSGTTGSDRLQGSCCSPMDIHRYAAQIEGLKKYGSNPKIPPDPYDIDAALAKELASYYDLPLTPDEQQAYDYAMAHSMEKGPCCCKCWRWYVYGGLGKYLIQNDHFTGEQVMEVWNLSDGCGGAE